jgi:hypothetical protein
MMMTRFWVVVLGLFLLVTGCGKVVQEVAKDDVPLSFNVSFKSGDIIWNRSKTKTAGVFDVNDKEVITQISAFEKNKLVELSWGRAVLSKKDLPVPTDKDAQKPKRTLNDYESVAYRKNGLKLVGASDHTWSKISYDKKEAKWDIKSNKVKRGYPYYQIALFSEKDHFLLKVVDDKMVSSNKTVELGALDDYDRFIAIIANLIFKDRGDYLVRPDTLDRIHHLFPVSFFKMLSYNPPKNSVKQFVSERPQFILSGPFERELVKWFFLFDEDVQAGKDYLISYKSPWFTKSIRKKYAAIIAGFEAGKALSD